MNQETPKLRFKDFKDSWTSIHLYNISEFFNGKGHEQFIKDKGNYIVVNSKFVSTNGAIKKYSDKNLCPLKKGDIAIVMSDIPNGKALGKCYLIDEENKYSLNQRIGGIRPKSTDSRFLYRILNRNSYFLEFDNGVSQTNLRKNEILNCKISIPKIQEQSKISDFLENIDKYIENLKSQKEELEKYKKGMMQKIFSQQIRFKDDNGNNFPEWKVHSFIELIEERKSKSKINNEYEVISSTIKGIFSQKEYFDREIASKNNIGYKIIHLNDLVFSPQNLWLGNINVNRRFENGIVSPSYKVYKIKNETVLTKYLINIIKLPRMLYEYELSSEQGASVVRRNLNLELFYSIPIKLPCINEQFKISEFLSQIDNAIKQKENELIELEKWKKGLMQKMLL